jgi:hypothetical protein
MTWDVDFDLEFAAEVDQLPEKVADELRAHALLLQEAGPQLGRPWCDTLKASGHSNMKELRFNAEKGVWRVAFAFDSDRKAILLVAGNKKGADQTKFYERLIKTADARFTKHLEALKAMKAKKGRGR